MRMDKSPDVTRRNFLHTSMDGAVRSFVDLFYALA
jgi:hypothetical protein